MYKNGRQRQENHLSSRVLNFKLFVYPYPHLSSIFLHATLSCCNDEHWGSGITRSPGGQYILWAIWALKLIRVKNKNKVRQTEGNLAPGNNLKRTLSTTFLNSWLENLKLIALFTLYNPYSYKKGFSYPSKPSLFPITKIPTPTPTK